jgi:predicted flap endonuclease-1-like 5' DNA nuclease
MADLMRISGVGEEYSELLEAAGVNTVKDLRRRNPENLTSKIRTTNERLKLVRVLPTEKMVADWVERAKRLPQYVTY